MDRNSILVLANPAEATLSYLERLPPDTSLAVGEDPEAFRNLADAADVILSWSTKKGLLEAAFGIAPNVKWVHSRAAGLDGLLFPALVESPVTLTNGRGLFSQSLGEFALAAVLFFAKDLRRMVRSQMAGQWDQFEIDDIRFQTMGIVGYGDIGRACAQRAKAFGMTVLGVRKSPEQSAGDPYIDRIYPMEKLHEVLAHSDYVVVATPLTPETRGLIGDEALRSMKPASVIINLGRGPVIEEAALIRALQSRRILGAALDVFDVEPLPPGHAYYSLDNLLLSPHCADHTRDWQDQAMLFFLRNFERYRAGECLLNVVDKTRGY